MRHGLGAVCPQREAYERAVEMMAACGKAAVVHPTGTGKSFIGFELARRHAATRVLWLTPSELHRAHPTGKLGKGRGGGLREHPVVTYSKLKLLAEDELALLCPEYIVLDEFHRCGAEKWGQGVQRLLGAYPRAGLLGLSATNVRYLDNRARYGAGTVRGAYRQLYDAGRGRGARHSARAGVCELGVFLPAEP